MGRPIRASIPRPAMVLLVGYSVTDKMVVYDRIRENAIARLKKSVPAARLRAFMKSLCARQSIAIDFL
jgi:preprotein translocase subunit SecF